MYQVQVRPANRGLGAHRLPLDGHFGWADPRTSDCSEMLKGDRYRSKGADDRIETPRPNSKKSIQGSECKANIRETLPVRTWC